MFHIQVRSVLAGTTMVRDVVLQRIHVMKERETVMDLVMVVSMMVMLGAGEILCVAATTVSSLELTTTPRMTAVRDLMVRSHLSLLQPLAATDNKSLVSTVPLK